MTKGTSKNVGKLSREFKLAAVKKVIEQGLTYAEVARDLGIRDTRTHYWKKKFEVDGTLQAEVTSSTTVEYELTELPLLVDSKEADKILLAKQ